MAEYIDKKQAIGRIASCYCMDCEHSNGILCRACEHQDDMDLIDDMPAAGVQPAKRGRWEKDEKGQFHHCSECEAETLRDVDSWGLDYGEYLSDFCPCCGADMREANATKG